MPGRTPSPRRLCPAQLIDGRNFGRKRENAGRNAVQRRPTGGKKGRVTGAGAGAGGGGRGNKKGSAVTPTGLISQQCDLFALYSHKEPTLLCHYVTKEGVIAQRGPPVRLHRRRMALRTVMGSILPLSLSFSRNRRSPPSSTTRGVSLIRR